jgi:hypothetical protein
MDDDRDDTAPEYDLFGYDDPRAHFEWPEPLSVPEDIMWRLP